MHEHNSISLLILVPFLWTFYLTLRKLGSLKPPVRFKSWQHTKLTVTQSLLSFFHFLTGSCYPTYCFTVRRHFSDAFRVTRKVNAWCFCCLVILYTFFKAHLTVYSTLVWLKLKMGCFLTFSHTWKSGLLGRHFHLLFYSLVPQCQEFFLLFL